MAKPHGVVSLPPPLPQTSAHALQVFPLTQTQGRERKAVKRSLTEMSTSHLAPVLFPSTDDILSDELRRSLGGASVFNPPPKRQRAAGPVAKPPPVPSSAPNSNGKRFRYSPANEFGLRLRTPFALYPHQRDTLRWLQLIESRKIRHPQWDDKVAGGMLAMVMGLGKTLVMASLIASTLAEQKRQGSCTLFVCPRNLLGTVRWEFEKFFGDQLRVGIYNSSFQRSAFTRFGQTDIRRFDVLITNYATVMTRVRRSGLVPWKASRTRSRTPGPEADVVLTDPPTAAQALEIRHAREFTRFPWFRLVLDECQDIRNRRTLTFRAMNELCAPRRWVMSGTPIYNGLGDLFSELHVAGLRVPKNTRCTRAAYERLRLSRMIRFVELKDASEVKLPAKTVHHLFFDLSPQERWLHDFFLDSAQKRFRSIREQAVSGLAKGQEMVETKNRLMKAVQVCAAPYVMTGQAKMDSDHRSDVSLWAQLPADLQLRRWLTQGEGAAGTESNKMKRFVTLWQTLKRQDPGVKAVVFATMSSVLQVAIQALTRACGPGFEKEHVFVHGGISSPRKRDEMYTRFRLEPQTRLLFSTLHLGATGLNLSEANTVIFLQPWFTYAVLAQGEGRVHRTGQTRPVSIYYLLARNSAEERMFRRAEEKRDVAESIVSSRVNHGINGEDLQTLLFVENESPQKNIVSFARTF